MEKKYNKIITTGSDFSGVGAFDEALERLGIIQDKKFACDMDKFVRQTYILNYGEPAYYPKNVYNREIPMESLDIYMTSPPCQGFSISGKREGSILFLNSHEFIQKNKPRFFIFENVKGLLSHDKRNKKHKYGKTFNEWIGYLGGKSINGNPTIFSHDNSVPYHIYHKVLNAKHYGVPQNRERVFIIGIRDDKNNKFTWPKPIPLTKRLKDVLETFETSDFNTQEEFDKYMDKYYLSERSINYLINRKIENKKNNRGFGAKITDENDISSCLDSRYGVVRNSGETYLQIKSATKKGYEIATENDSIDMKAIYGGNRGNIVYKDSARALDHNCNQAVIGAIRGRNPDNPKSRITGEQTEQMLEVNENGTSNALTTVQKDNVMVETNYKIRRLTPRECFRLMDFPDTFKMVCSDTQMYKQAGNSIVVGVLSKIISKLKL